VANLREVLNAPAGGRSLKILQLPVVPGGPNSWIGTKFPEGYVPPPNATSMAFEFSAPFTPVQPVAGIFTDDWREKVPVPTLTAGVSIHYNQANNEAPQCLLLAVPPKQAGAWNWDTLMDTVLETMLLARKRAVDTELLQSTWLS
jgi:hypothetical protein